MNIEMEKSELINWINSLKDSKIIQDILALKKKSDVPNKQPRKFGDGKHIFTYVADDFNEPLEDFKEYME